MLKIIRNYFKNKEKLKLAKLKDEMETITGKPIKKISMEQFLKNIKEYIKSETIFTYVDGLEKENNKQKEVIDKIKEYCNHKLEMLELQKRNIIQILTPENGYLKTDIEIEMQKYKDILELLEGIE